MSKLTPAEFLAILERGMPSAHALNLDVRSIEHGSATLVLPVDASHLRPGATLAGPTLFMLADLALYAAVMGAIGPVENAVTTSMTLNFLRRAGAEAPLRAEAKLLKLGRRLAVGDVSLYVGDALVAHATGTYSIP
ncbi:PaaI family thioesterase [Roseiterribacter gracilis]|uniref:Thioesterase domain-containing protein n=1 Tax=Roseiterribacter gracilis TaxID=2812848 RepID=A0A8S8XDZ8_9PROT|nr:hypothetical protein TMPK1_18640 [Rhodospirillales bacterium TMPK1]